MRIPVNDLIMNKIISVGLAVFCCLPLLGCKQTLPEDLPEFPKPTEQIDRVPLTRAEEGFVKAGNQFAWTLTRKVWKQNEDGKSLILSPLSVQYALGMLGNGADETVAKQLAAVLGYEGVDAINAYCKKLMTNLPMVDTTVTLALANGVLANDRYALKAPFKSAVEGSYDALVKSMSFQDPVAVVKYVNDWCNQHTYGRIPEVIKDVDPSAFAFLMNAIYFNGRWIKPFEKSLTQKEDFKTLSGSKVKVSMMHQHLTSTYDYSENDVCQALRLPYGNGRFCLNVYLPKEKDGLSALLENPTQKLSSKLCHVNLSLPAFRTDYDVDMKDLLAGMGLPLHPYNEIADLPAGAFGEISRVIHKANITVDETGSEAAAVTVIEMKVGAALPPQETPTIDFTADHPFLYTITEATSGVILFTGVFTGK